MMDRELTKHAMRLIREFDRKSEVNEEVDSRAVASLTALLESVAVYDEMDDDTFDELFGVDDPVDAGVTALEILANYNVVDAISTIVDFVGLHISEETDDDYLLDDIPDADMQRVLGFLNLPTKEALLESLGMGNLLPQIVARQLVQQFDTKTTPTQNSNSNGSIAIRGTEGLVVSYARCCLPLPGDEVMGHISAGRGIVIHRHKCKNMIAELRHNPDKCMALRWSEKVNREFQTELRISSINQRGILAVIASIVTDNDANIDSVSVEEKASHYGIIHLVLTVRDRIHLAQIIKRLRVLNGIDRVTRHSA